MTVLRPTDAEKRAVWAAIAPPARLFFRGIADDTGLDFARVYQVWAEGSSARKMRVHDDGPGFRFIERVTA